MNRGRRNGNGSAVAVGRLSGLLRVRPGRRFRLRDDAADRRFGWTEEQAAPELLRMKARLGELQYQMYADGRYGLLVVLQAIDGGGKDSTIRHVASAFNPQGCTVTAFKAPSAEELRHDFLWRVHGRVPARGEVGIFNRSHYEDVLIARVHRWIDKEECGRRYRHINHFERLLADSGTIILKFFLHISKGEQKRRLEERLRNPVKNWKIGVEDVKERAFWAGYMRAYERAISVCSTEAAPWFIIPSDHKPVRNALVSEIIVRTLETVRFRLPRAAPGLARLRIR